MDVVIYEFENVPQETANFLSQFVPIRPPVRALMSLRSADEKTSLRVRPGRLSEIETYEDLQEVYARFDGQGIIKTRRFGYDGRPWRMTPKQI